MIWFKRVGLFVVSLLLLVSLLLTPWGTTFLLSMADGLVDELSIEHQSGGLGGTLKLTSVKWQTEELNLQLSDVDLNIGWSCTLALNVCVEQFSSQKVSVAITSNQEPEVQTDSSPAQITLPLPVEIEHIQINQFSLDIEDNLAVNFASLDTRLSFYKQLNIYNFNMTKLQIYLTEAESQASQTASTGIDIEAISNWQYVPPELPPIFIPLDIDVQQLALNQITVFQGEAQTLNLASLATQLTIVDSEVDIKFFELQHSLAVANIVANVSKDYRLDIDAQVQSTTSSEHQFSLQSFVSGTPESYTLELTSKGWIDLKADAQVAIDSAQLPADVHISWSEFQLPVDDLISIDSGTLSLQGDLQAYRLTLDTGVDAKTLPKTRVQLEALGNNQTLTLNRALLSLLHGELNASGNLTLTEQAIWQGQVTAKNIQPNVQWPKLEAAINGVAEYSFTYNKSSYSAQLEKLKVDGVWQSYPIQIDATGDYDSITGLRIDDSIIATGDNRLLISGTLDEQQKISGLVTIDAKDFSQLDGKVQGSATGSAKISGSIEQPVASYQLSANQLSFQDLTLSQFQSDGSFNWDEEKTVNSVTTLSNLTVNAQHIDLAKVELSGTQKSHALKTMINSNIINLDSLIVGTLNQSSWQGEWQRANIESDYGDYQLSNSPTQLLADWGNQHFQISPHCWQEKVSKLCIQAAQLVDKRIKIDMQGSELALLQWLNQFAPQTQRVTSDTKLNFSIQGDWHQDDLPVFKAQGHLTPALFEMETLANPINMQKFDFVVEAKGDTIDSRFDLATAKVGNVALQLSIHDLAEKRDLLGSVAIQQLLLSPYAPLIPDLSEFSGEVNGKLNVYGTLNRPLLKGELSLQQVEIAGDAIPGKLEKWDQSVQFNEQSAKFAGQFIFGGGTGSSEGELDWSNEIVGHVNLKGESLEIDYRDTVRARFSPDVSVNLQEDAIQIGGSVDVLYARVKVKELPPSAESPSADEVIINQPDNTEQPSARPVRVALKINIDPNKMNDVKLDAFGLKSDLRGSLELNKEKSLEGFGDLQLFNGTYQAYGQDLVIRKGDILFSGPMDNPHLDIEAIRDPDKTKDDVIAGIRVSGPAIQPGFDLFSEPSFNQSQTLSYLIRGQAIEDQSGSTSGDQLLANALISAGLERGENRIDRLGRKLGIEDLSLGTSNDANGTQVSLSGYIAPGVQLIYGVNVFDSSSEISLRYQLLPKLFFEATSGVESALDLYYQFTSGNANSE